MSKNNTFESEQLTDAAYYILLSLVKKRHGYAVMQYIEQLTGGLINLGPATLYTLLKKMNLSGFIEQIDLQDDKKKLYKLTEKGYELLKNEVNRRCIMSKHGVEILKEFEEENI